MKKLIAIFSLMLLMTSLFTLTAFAQTAQSSTPCEGCEVCNPSKEANIDEMPEMEFNINVDNFVDALGYMGKGMLGIFVVTLVIVGVVAVLNWHGRSLEKRNENKNK